MKLISIDDYHSKCITTIHGEETEILFGRNDYEIMFVYWDGDLICIVIPETITKHKPDVVSDINRLYGDKLPVIIMPYLHETSFSHGLVIGYIIGTGLCKCR